MRSVAVPRAVVAFIGWALVGLGLAGCAGTSLPSFGYSGPASYQRRQAERFDPYPENDTAPPVEGGRPPGYESPKPEWVRARDEMPKL